MAILGQDRPPLYLDPVWAQNHSLRAELRLSEGVVLALRRKLREVDATLPSEYDGAAWELIEAPYWDPDKLAEARLEAGR